MRLTYIGTATVLIEVAGLRILTDPALDPPGRTYGFGWGTKSKKTEGPALTSEQIGAVDLVLLSHDQHADNLDDAGRAHLARAKRVLTTTSGARRLSKRLGEKVQALAVWTTYTDAATGLKIHSVPAKHGEWPLPQWVVGETIGFVVEEPGGRMTYITGDTVYFKAIPEIARRFPKIENAIIHLGCVGFGITGPLKYTFDSVQAFRAIQDLKPKKVIPLHYEGWTHFREPSTEAFQRLESHGITLTRMPRGQAIEV